VEKIEYPYDTSTVFDVPSPTDDTSMRRSAASWSWTIDMLGFALDPRIGLFSTIRLVFL